MAISTWVESWLLPCALGDVHSLVLLGGVQGQVTGSQTFTTVGNGVGEGRGAASDGEGTGSWIYIQACLPHFPEGLTGSSNRSVL